MFMSNNTSIIGYAYNGNNESQNRTLKNLVSSYHSIGSYIHMSI